MYIVILLNLEKKQLYTVPIKPFNEVVGIEMRVLYSKNIYSKKALLKAAYHFTDRYYVYLGVEGDSFFVDFTSKSGDIIDGERLQNQFKNEILAQVIHLVVANETSDLRKLVVARALSSTMIDEERNNDETNNRPTNIDEISLNELSAIARDWYDGK
jgi:hypothetical protein